jgi:hypothetical protein
LARRGLERNARRWRAGRWRWRAIARAGEQGGKGKEAGEVPHPKAELQRRLATIEEWRGSGGDGDQGALAKAALAWAARQEAAAAGLADPGARGGGFIGRPRGPWPAGPGCRAAGKAVPWLDSA